MTALLDRLSAHELVAFVLVLARVAPLFLIGPVLSSKLLPLRVRGVAAVGVALGLTPLASANTHVPTALPTISALLAEGFLVGFGLAFAFAVVLGALETAGSFLDLQGGLSFGNLINPELGIEGSAFAEIYTLLGSLIFVAIGGIEWLIRGLARTFSLVPLDGTVKLGPLVNGAASAFSTIFTSALEVLAPILVALAITDVAFGVLSRVVPQMNVFAIGFSAKIAVAVLMVVATLPFVGNWLFEAVYEPVGLVLGGTHPH